MTSVIRDDGYIVYEDGTVIGLRGRPIKGSVNSRGYLQVSIGGDRIFTHRLVAKAFIPNPENKPTINHIDGDKLNNRVGNLEWATHAENTAHAYSTGVRPSGGDNPLSKLTSVEAALIRESYKSNYRGWQAAMARSYGVSRAVIRQIVAGRNYKTYECIT
jgi:hypothetical protein